MFGFVLLNLMATVRFSLIILSQFMHDFVNKQRKIVHIFYFYTLPFLSILTANRRLGRDWGGNGEQKTPDTGYKA